MRDWPECCADYGKANVGVGNTRKARVEEVQGASLVEKVRPFDTQNFVKSVQRMEVHGREQCSDGHEHDCEYVHMRPNASVKPGRAAAERFVTR